MSYPVGARTIKTVNSNPHGLVVGQKLWFVPAYQQDGFGQDREVEVGSVGNKWATLVHQRMRVSLATLTIDGGIYSSPGRCHLDRAAYEAKRNLERVWQAFARRVSPVSVPDGVTIADITKAAELFGIKISESE